MANINLQAEKLATKFILAKESWLSIALELNEFINKNGLGPLETLPKENFNEIKSVLNEYNLKMLQASVDHLLTANIVNYSDPFITEDEEVVVFGQYDDESGYYPDEMECGPLRFNSEGEFIWIEEKVQQILQESKDNFIDFYKKFGLVYGTEYDNVDHSSKENLSSNALILLNASNDELSESIIIAESTENLSSAVSEICEYYLDIYADSGSIDYISCFGRSPTLADLFFVTANSCYNAPLHSDRQSFHISWIMRRA